MYNPLGQQPKQEKRFYSPSEARTITQRPPLFATRVRGRSQTRLRPTCAAGSPPLSNLTAFESGYQ